MLSVSEAFSTARAVSHGWAALKREPVGLLLGCFLLSMVEGGGGGGGGGDFSNLGSGGSSGGSTGTGTGDWGGGSDWSNALDGMGGFEDPAVLALAAVALSCVCIVQIGTWLAASFLKPGYLRLHQELLFDGASSPARLFSGGAHFKSMAMWKLLKGVVGLGTLVVAATPGGGIMLAGAYTESQPLLVVGGLLLAALALPASIYVGLGLVLGEHAVVFDELGPMDALERSWSLASGNRTDLALFSLGTGFFSFLGVFACCIGLFPTTAMMAFGWSEAYLLATREDWESWRFIEEEGLG